MFKPEFCVPEDSVERSSESPSSKKPPIPRKPSNLGGSGLDLSSRDEKEGSAFELYQKSDDESNENSAPTGTGSDR